MAIFSKPSYGICTEKLSEGKDICSTVLPLA